MLQLDADQAVFSYNFSGSANIARVSSVLIIAVSSSRRNPHVVRKSFNCPGCERRAQKLFLVASKWACRVCHDLVYLKQRLGSVNKKIHDRDALLALLKQAPTDHQRKRRFHNQQRHLDRINRELAAAGFTSLPQELLFRTYEHWLAPGEVTEAGRKSGQDVAPLALDAEADHAVGLAFFQPKRPVLEPVLACELIGSEILYRPLRSSLSRHMADQAERLRQDITNEEVPNFPVGSSAFATLLAERCIMRPIALTSEWSDMEEGVGDGGCREYSVTATYEGDRTLWRAGPGAKPCKRVLRAILDDETITLRARSPMTGRSDPRADLDAAIAELGDRLARVEKAFAEFNTRCHYQVGRWLLYNWRRLERPMIRFARSPATHPA